MHAKPVNIALVFAIAGTIFPAIIFVFCSYYKRNVLSYVKLNIPKIQQKSI